MTTSTDGTPSSVTPEPENGSGAQEDHLRDYDERDEADEGLDSGSSWLHEEIQRRMADGRSRTGGRHARRDSVSPGSVGYVPRHSVATPGPGAPRPGPVGGSPSAHASELLRRERTGAGPAGPAAWSGPPPAPDGTAESGRPGGDVQTTAPGPFPSHRPAGHGAAPGTGPTPPGPELDGPETDEPDAYRFEPADLAGPGGTMLSPSSDVQSADEEGSAAPADPGQAAGTGATASRAGARRDTAAPETAPVRAWPRPIPTRARPSPGPTWLGAPPGPPPGPAPVSPPDGAIADEPDAAAATSPPVSPPAGTPSPGVPGTSGAAVPDSPTEVTGPSTPVPSGTPLLGDPVFTARTPEPGSREWRVVAGRVPEQRRSAQLRERIGPEDDDQEDLQSKRVRVVLAERKGVARPVRTVVDIQEGTGVGEFLRNDLIKTQLVMALRFAVGAGLALGLLPLLFAMVPEIGRIELLGLRLPWILLGLLVYPFLFGLALWHTRLAERVEQSFADHVQD